MASEVATIDAKLCRGWWGFEESWITFVKKLDGQIFEPLRLGLQIACSELLLYQTTLKATWTVCIKTSISFFSWSIIFNTIRLTNSWSGHRSGFPKICNSSLQNWGNASNCLFLKSLYKQSYNWTMSFSPCRTSYIFFVQNPPFVVFFIVSKILSTLIVLSVFNVCFIKFQWARAI